MAVLGGCTSLSPDSGFKDVEKLASSRVEQRVQWNRTPEDDKAAAEITRDLLARPLTADAAVQVALLNNRGLQAVYGDLGVAEAELVSASRLANPVISGQRWAAGDKFKLEFGIEFNIASLLLLPLKVQAQQANFEYAKLRVGDEIIKLAEEVRAQHVRALAAEQAAAMQASISTSAEAAAELADRQYRAGNLSSKKRTRHELVQAETALRLSQMRRQAFGEREKLVRLMGLRSGGEFSLPTRLPEVPAARPQFENLEELALERRLDILAARQELEVAAKALGVTDVARFVDSVTVGYGALDESGEPRKRGPSLSLELPLFDQGGGRVYRDTTRLKQSEDRLAQTATNARSEVREKYNDLLAAHDEAARVQKSIVPLRQRILAQTQLAYNGMLEGIYDLLDSYREGAASGQMAIDAVRDYWIALAGLERAAGGKLSATPNRSTGTEGSAP